MEIPVFERDAEGQVYFDQEHFTQFKLICTVSTLHPSAKIIQKPLRMLTSTGNLNGLLTSSSA